VTAATGKDRTFSEGEAESSVLGRLQDAAKEKKKIARNDKCNSRNRAGKEGEEGGRDRG